MASLINRKRYIAAAIALWLLLVLFLSVRYSNTFIRPFDPRNALSFKAMHPEFDEQLVAILNTLTVKNGTITHIQASSDCYCQQLTKPHIEELKNQKSLEHFKHISLPLSEALKAWVPSSPAVIVVDHNNQLRFVGPYAQGYGCFSGQNLVNLISAISTNKSYYGAVVLADAEGCFC